MMDAGYILKGGGGQENGLLGGHIPVDHETLLYTSQPFLF